MNLLRFSLGNLGDGKDTVKLSDPICSLLLLPVQCKVRKDSLGVLYATIDVAVSITALIAVIWLKYFQRLEARRVDEDTLDAHHFTVYLPFLPPGVDLNGDAIKEHFLEVLKDNSTGRPCRVADVNIVESSYPMLSLFKQKKKSDKQIEKLRNTLHDLKLGRGDRWRYGSLADYDKDALMSDKEYRSDPDYIIGQTEPFISRIPVCGPYVWPSYTERVRRTEWKIHHSKERGRFIQELILETIGAVKMSSHSRPKRRETHRTRINHLGMNFVVVPADELEAGEVADEISNARAIAAFVTFEKVESLRKCLEMYPNNIISYLRQPKALRLRTRKSSPQRLTVLQG